MLTHAGVLIVMMAALGWYFYPQCGVSRWYTTPAFVLGACLIAIGIGTGFSV